MNTPEALRLAHIVEFNTFPRHPDHNEHVAAELRLLHAEACGLRAVLQERDAEITKLKSVNLEVINWYGQTEAKLAVYCKVLEQALEVLESMPTADSDCDEQTQREDDALQEAITAIQEQLK